MKTDIDAMRALHKIIISGKPMDTQPDDLALWYRKAVRSRQSLYDQLPAILDELEAARAEIARLRSVLREAGQIVADRAAGGRMITPKDHAQIVGLSIMDILKNGEKLGADFEKVWDDNVGKLYEP